VRTRPRPRSPLIGGSAVTDLLRGRCGG
jgi:hypothetical protein